MSFVDKSTSREDKWIGKAKNETTTRYIDSQALSTQIIASDIQWYQVLRALYGSYIYDKQTEKKTL